MLTPAAAAPKAELFFGVRNARDFATGKLADFGTVGLHAPDPRTVLVDLAAPNPHFLAYVACGPWIPVNPRVVARFGRQWTRPEHFVGNGAYCLAEWLPNQRIVVRKNLRYHGAANIRLRELQFIRFDNGESEERAYRAGQIDVTMSVPFSKLATEASERPAELHRLPLAETRYLAFNTQRAALVDPRVRRALSLALDRETLVTAVLQGGQVATERLLPPASPAPPRSPAADADTARRLLAEAGFPGGRGFPRLELSDWTGTQLLEAIQARWKKILGIDVSLAVRDARSHVAALRSGAYDIGFVALLPDVPDPLEVLRTFTTGSPNNYPHWSDATFDAETAAGSPAAAQTAEDRLLDAQAVAPLYFNVQNWLMRPTVQGWGQDGLWNRYYGNLNLEAAPSPGGTRAAKVLHLGNGAEPQDLDPQTVPGVPEHRIIMSLFEGLVTEDPHDLHPVPGLAKAWEISPDGLTYTFHLRENARWSNGEPITADDYVQSYRRLLTPALAADYAYLIYNFMVGADDYYHGRLTDFGKVGVKALDAHTLRITLTHATPFLLRVIACTIAWDAVPVKVIARYGSLTDQRTAWTRAGHLVGSGPFRLASWRPNQKIVVERNPYYWDAARVKLDAIEFYPTEDMATEERMFRTGQLDATYELPVTKIDGYRRDHPGELRIDPWLGLYYYLCNVERPPLTDKRVRRALALAIDRESLVKDVMRGGEIPAYAVSYPGTAGYVPKAHLAGGVAEARQLLAEAGFPGGRGFPRLELLYNTQQTHRQMAEAIQAMWRKNLGIEIQLRNEEWKVYLDARHTHNFQIARAGWIADYLDPNVFLEIWETGNGNNDTRWSNAEYDRLFHAALAAGNDTERYAIFQKMDAILVDECPVLPIFYYTRVYALSPRVKGWWPTLTDDHPWKYVDLE